jgi:hypothetical protein
MARAKSYEAQVKALGQGPTAVVNAVDALAKSQTPFMPEILVAGGEKGIMDALGAQVLKSLK